MNKRIIGISCISAGLVIGIIGFVSCSERIPAGYNGVVYSLNGGVTGEVLGQGLHFMSPLKHVSKYPVSTETMYLSKEANEGSKQDDSFNISTKDGKLVNVDAELSYHYNPEQLDEVYTKWRGKSPDEIENSYIKARVKSICNEITSKYGVMDVYGEKRTEINTTVYEQLGKVLEEDGIVLETFAFTRIEPDAQTQQAIQAKVDAQQKLEQDKIEAERQAVANQRKIDEEIAKQEQENIINTERNKRIKENAEANAQAILKEAEAQAKANKLISESLTSNLLDLKQIEAWQSGGAQVPTIQGGDITPFVDMTNINK